MSIYKIHSDICIKIYPHETIIQWQQPNDTITFTAVKVAHLIYSCSYYIQRSSMIKIHTKSYNDIHCQNVQAQDYIKHIHLFENKH